MIINALIENNDLLDELLEIPELSGIYLSGEHNNPTRLKKHIEKCHEAGKACYYAFPYIFRDRALEYYERYQEELKEAGCDGWLIRSLDEAGFVSEKELPGLRIFDAGMYSWNKEAVAQMKCLGADILTAPYELTHRELKERGMEDTELVVYGHIPVMISAQCIQKTTKGCKPDAKNGYKLIQIKDRKNAGFLAENRCLFCYNVIYNSVPLWILDRTDSFPERIRFHFPVENKGEPSRIIRDFLKGRQTPHDNYTRGHFARGVE